MWPPLYGQMRRPTCQTSPPGGRNTWLIGDEREVIAIDAVADPDEVLDAVDG